MVPGIAKRGTYPIKLRKRFRRKVLKEGIHPVYKEAQVTCACGETFTTRSTKETIRVDICSKCHPFFTGKQKIVDPEGRVQKFQRKYAKK